MTWGPARRLPAPAPATATARVFSSYARRPGRRPKKKLYHREPSLDRAADLSKIPRRLILLRRILLSHHPRPLPLRDFEKEVGFVEKWNLIPLLSRYPALFHASARPFPAVSLSPKALQLSSLEAAAREQMEPVMIRNLRKLLMLSVDGSIAVEKVEVVAGELGLPDDWRESLAAGKYSEWLSVKSVRDVRCLCLESWDAALSVTAREEKLDVGRPCVDYRKVVPRDGNVVGPFSFRLKYPSGFRPNKSYLQEVVRWQQMAFPSPYLNARQIEPGTPSARKRAVAVLHELLSLMMERRLTTDKIEIFHSELQLPSKLLLCLVKHHGIFYLTNKGAHSTVFLKEAYDGSELIDKCPLLQFYDKFMLLIGRQIPEMKSLPAG